MQDGRTTRWARAPGRPGWTLLECVLAVAIMAAIFAAAVPLLHAGRVTFDAAEPRVLVSQEARFALSMVSASLRQAWAVTAVSNDGAGNASVSFLSRDGQPTVLSRDAATKQLFFGPVGATAVIAKNCTGLSVRGYTAGGQLLSPLLADPTGAAAVEIAMTVADAKGRIPPTTLTTRAAVERTPRKVIINEIMYDPPGAFGSWERAQWVELYNASPAAVDVAGWGVWTKGQSVPVDGLIPDVLYSTGSGVIPPGGYALVTSWPSDLYREVLSNGDFEGGTGGWQFDTSRWMRSMGGAYSGNYKIHIWGGGWTTMYQDFKIPSDANNPCVLVRARMDQGSVPQSRLIIRITNRSSTVLLPIYDGLFTSGWTTYRATVPSSIINTDARLEIKVNASSSSDGMHVDAVGIVHSRLPTHSPDCLHLWVNDKEIGSDISKKQLFLGQGAALHDVAVWDPLWGGSHDGTTLSRVGPYAPSTEPSSWKPGPYGGTPAAPNGGGP